MTKLVSWRFGNEKGIPAMWTLGCFAGALALLCTFVRPASAQAPHEQTRTPIDRIVAIVNGEVITAQEVEAQSNIDSSLTEKFRLKALKDALERHIEELLLDQEVKRHQNQLGVTQKDVDRAIDEVLRQNQIDVMQLKVALVAQGLDFDTYQKKLRGQIERTRLLQMRMQNKNQAGEDKVKERCLQAARLGAKSFEVCASHIVVHVPPNATAQERQALVDKLNSLRQQLKNGADFAAMAAKESDDTTTQGGDLGCFGPGEMVDDFEKVAFALEPNTISKVFDTSVGLHLLRVNQKRQKQASTCDNEAQLSPFRNAVMQEEMAHQMQSLMASLKDKASIQKRL